MPVLSCYVSIVAKGLKMVQSPASSADVYTTGLLDSQTGVVNPQMLFICTVGSCDWVHSGWPHLNVQHEMSFEVSL